MKIEKSYCDSDEVALLTPSEVQSLVDASSDASDFERRLAAAAGGRQAGMLQEYTGTDGKQHYFRWLNGMPITTGRPPKIHDRRIEFTGKGFRAIASSHTTMG